MQQTSAVAPYKADAASGVSITGKPHKVYPTYPAEALADHESGTVVLDATIAGDGTISDLRVIKGPSDLKRETLRAVALWTFPPTQTDETHRTVTIRYVLQDISTAESNDADLVVGTKQEAPRFTVASFPKALPPGCVRLTPFQGSQLVVKKREPVYPEQAKRNGVTGMVVLHITIDKTGRLKDVYDPVGPQMFVPAAEDAVKRWDFKPYVVDGTPKEVETTVAISFQ